MTGKQVAGLAGFLALGLSPSFIDWKQSPDKRWQIIGFYVVAVALFWYGVLS